MSADDVRDQRAKRTTRRMRNFFLMKCNEVIIKLKRYLSLYRIYLLLCVCVSVCVCEATWSSIVASGFLFKS